MHAGIGFLAAGGALSTEDQPVIQQRGSKMSRSRMLFPPRAVVVVTCWSMVGWVLFHAFTSWQGLFTQSQAIAALVGLAPAAHQPGTEQFLNQATALFFTGAAEQHSLVFGVVVASAVLWQYHSSRGQTTTVSWISRCCSSLTVVG